jgi:nucleotide-binding universal stress UspA family protein
VGHCRDAASHAALEVAADLAVRLHAELHVVHCIDLSDYPIDPDAHDWEAQAQATLAEEQRQVRQALVEHPGRWTYHAAHGHPVALLAQIAEEHDALFIVVGNHGEGFSPALRRLMHGRSVSHGLIGRKRRPVLVVTAAKSAATTSQAPARAGSVS